LDPESFWRQTFRSYAIVMRGRAKGRHEQTVILAHQIEAMARQKMLRGVSHYLPKDKKSASTGASEVLAMFSRAKERQDLRTASG